MHNPVMPVNQVNNVIKLYKTFCANHKILKDFQYMVPKDRFVTNDYVFPLVLIEPVDFQFATGEVKFSHNLYFIDLVDRDLTNYFSIISNMEQCALDMYNFFNDNEEDYGFIIYNDATATPVMSNEFEDWVCGVVLPITLQLQNPRDETVIPIDPQVIQD